MQYSQLHAVHGALKRMKNGLQPQNTENRDKAGQYWDPRTYITLRGSSVYYLISYVGLNKLPNSYKILIKLIYNIYF